MNKISKKINIAAIGCLHGKLEVVYKEISKYELQNKISIDLVIICGDFQTVRDYADLEYVKMPDKYKHLGDFHLYYKGKKEIPYLTLFIGGNHEASNVLDTFFNGGFLCKNLFYMGKTGIVNFKGIKIAGLSGIFNEKSYYKGFYEERNLLKDEISQKISIYHVREYDIAKLNMYNKPIDIFISHDWPQGVIDKKDADKIVKIKRAWENEVYEETLGSGPSRYLMNKLKPKYWLAGHMHYYYRNTIKHNISESTEFIALDKIIDKSRQFLDFITIEVNVNSNDLNENLNIADSLTFDETWLALSNTFYEYLPKMNKLYDFSGFMIDKKDYEQCLNKVMTFFPKNRAYVKCDSSFNSKFKNLEKSITNYLNINQTQRKIKDNFIDCAESKENNKDNDTTNKLEKDFFLSIQCDYMNLYFFDKVNGKTPDILKQIEFEENGSDINSKKNNFDEKNYSKYKQIEELSKNENGNGNNEEIDIDDIDFC